VPTNRRVVAAEILELGRDAWDKDRIRGLAVERLLEIIGEAANSPSASQGVRIPVGRDRCLSRPGHPAYDSEVTAHRCPQRSS
jgi:hypothetical protein